MLIVDDEAIICSLLQDYLEESGYNVTTAQTLSLARDQMAPAELPDVVVLDMSLPDGSGMTLLQEIRADDRTKNIPIILMTAHSSHKVEQATLGQKPNDLLMKPFNLKDFKRRLDLQIETCR